MLLGGGVDILSQFREISGFRGNYLVSQEGKIFSKKYGSFIKPFESGGGYKQVKLEHKGKQYNKSVHRLVAEAFCEGYSEELQVNHIDANRLNNHASNLEWVTAKENIADSIKRGTHYSLTKFRNTRVNQISKSGTILNSFDSMVEAFIATGVPNKNISKACNGKLKTAGGFVWEFSESKGVGENGSNK